MPMRLSSTNSRFANEPSVKLSRSKFKIPIHSHKLTFNNGDLIPIKVMEILPGDTVSLDLASVLRMSTPVKPVFDNVFLDVFAFFVPRRLTWVHWEEFMGANNQGPWDTNQPNYNLPQTKSPRGNVSYPSLSGSTPGYWFKEAPFNGVTSLDSDQLDYWDRLVARGVLYKKSSTYGVLITSSDTYQNTETYYICFRGWDVGSLAQYMGFPIGTSCEVDSGYFRAYVKIWNEFFRDQNYMNPANDEVSSDSDVNGSTALVSLGSSYDYVSQAVRGGRPLRVSRFHDYFSSGLPEPQFGDSVRILNAVAPLQADLNNLVKPKIFTDGNNLVSSVKLLSVTSSGNFAYSPYPSDLGNVAGAKMGMSVDLSGFPVSTISDLRNAFQVQKYLERSARYGRRYVEILLGQFGVVNPDYRLQRPELLCWWRKPLQVTQVLQTSSTDSISPQGNTAAYSLTVDKKSCFTKSFTEHGILQVLVCTRTSRSYQQGLPRWASRRKKLDFYFPVFAHLSEQPILNQEIFCHYDVTNASASYTYPKEVFAYQEAWAEYRYMNSQISGQFSSVAPESLDFWHYADYYEDDVYLSDNWLFEGPENLDRTLAVTSALSHQFYADFAFDITMVRAMPLYSIPGLADHF